MRRVGWLGIVIALAAPGDGAAQGGDPTVGYPAFSQAYNVPYVAGSGLTAPTGPRINVTIAGSTLALPVDTGSRGLYASTGLLPGIPNPTGPRGFIYLNSSARIFLGTWSTQTVTFPDAVVFGGAPTPAQAVVPVLVVDTLACSTTPAPGQSTASTTFATIPESGTVTLADGTVLPFSNHQITLNGGQAVSFTNPANTGILADVLNMGVGFDRSGQGTSPTNDQFNQQYNAFLNLLPMRTTPATMRAGFILRQSGIQLGLTSTDQGYAYTNLLPTGFATNPPSPPDWQAPLGTITYGGTTFPAGQVVVDTGIDFAILTLPGVSGNVTLPLTVNLINSGGAVSYEINADPANPLNPSSIQTFPPLLGVFSENWGSFRPQFFNTGRNILKLFDLLYDGVDGTLGLKPGGNSVTGGTYQFTLGAFPVPEVPPTPYTVPIFHSTTGNGAAVGPATQQFHIYASLGGGPLVPYLLDSGSPNLFATYGPWWPGTTAPTAATPPGGATFTFADGTSYTYDVVTTDVTLGSPTDGVLVSAPNVNVAQITNVGSATPLESYTTWQQNVGNATLGTALNDGTFGNFSAGLYGTNTLATVLAQIPLPPGLKSGFIIASGGASATQGTLTIGLTENAIASFPVRIPMTAAGNVLPGPGGGTSTLPAFLKTQVANSTVSLRLGDQTYSAPVGTVFDTGGGNDNVLYQSSTGADAVPAALFAPGTKRIASGAEFALSAPGASDFYRYVTGNTPARNQIVVVDNISGGIRINPGIALFYRYDVMFDLEDGIVGLRPIPEPTPPPPPAPTLAITAKRYAPDRRTCTVRGTAGGALPITRITYQPRGRGRPLVAEGRARWRFTLALPPGRTSVVLTATNEAGATVTRKVLLTRKAVRSQP